MATPLGLPLSVRPLVTVAENFPHRVTKGFAPQARGDGGARMAPPPGRVLVLDDGAGNFPAPSRWWQLATTVRPRLRRAGLPVRFTGVPN